MTLTGTQATATTSRLTRLRTRLQDDGLDALLISDGENRRYLSGFAGSAGYLLITQDDAVLVTDFRYVEQAGQQAPGYRVERMQSGTGWLPELISAAGARKVGFEADDITVDQLRRFTEAIADVLKNGAAASLVPTTGLTRGLRAVKDAHEMALLKRAIDIGDEAFDEVSATLEPGMTEAEVAWRIEMAVRSRGAESVSFDTIVGSGPNGALPHHRAGERVLREGEPIVIDMGARYMGYCSDLTRTVVLGQPDEIFKKVYDIVLGAQLTAIETVAAGMTGAEADRLARTVIEEAGYAEMFGHSLGHGVGLEVHENPGVGATSSGKLEDGMVFTIEPGIYMSGWGGVRIEDVVVLENGRARVLSRARKNENPQGKRTA